MNVNEHVRLSYEAIPAPSVSWISWGLCWPFSSRARQSPLWLRGLLEGRAHVCMQPAPCLVLAKVSVQNLSLFSFLVRGTITLGPLLLTFLTRPRAGTAPGTTHVFSTEQTSKQEVPFVTSVPGEKQWPSIGGKGWHFSKAHDLSAHLYISRATNGAF